MMLSLLATDNRTEACIASDHADLPTKHPDYYAMLEEVVLGRAANSSDIDGKIAKGVQLAPGKNAVW